MPGVPQKAVTRVHRNAVTAMLRGTKLTRHPEALPLIAFTRELARQMDEDPTSTRVQGSYLSALKDVRRMLLEVGRVESARPVKVEAPVEVPVERSPENVSKLADFKKRNKISG